MMDILQEEAYKVLFEKKNKEIEDLKLKINRLCNIMYSAAVVIQSYSDNNASLRDVKNHLFNISSEYEEKL